MLNVAAVLVNSVTPIVVFDDQATGGYTVRSDIDPSKLATGSLHRRIARHVEVVVGELLPVSTRVNDQSLPFLMR